MVEPHINIDLLLNPDTSKGISKAEMEEMEVNFQMFCVQLSNDMGIGSSVNVRMKKIQDQSESLKVKINGSDCRLTYGFRNINSIDPDFLKSEVPNILFQNRESFISSEISDEIRKGIDEYRLENRFPNLSRKEFKNYLRSFVRYFYSIKRGLQPLESGNRVIFKDKGEEIFEHLCNDLSSLNLILYLPDAIKNKKNKQSLRFNELNPLMQDGLFYEFGVRIPKMEIRWADTVPESHFCVQINDLRLPLSKAISENEIVSDISHDELIHNQLEGIPIVNPANNRTLNLIANRKGLQQTLEKKGFLTWDWAGYVILMVSAMVRKNRSAFWNLELQDYEIENLRQVYPNIVKVFLEKASPILFVKTMRNLLEDQIPIRNFIDVVETFISLDEPILVDSAKYITFIPYELNPILSSLNSKSYSAGDCADAIRVKLKRYLSHKFSFGSNNLNVYLLEPSVEDKFLKNDLDEADKNDIFDAINVELSHYHDPVNLPCILTMVEVRRKLQDLIKMEFPGLEVLAYQELSPQLNIQPIARITLLS
ncbi:FHIPEP family type III secretion protein [Cognataquiflexum rubidum]|uniref:FHIPEP family type III secretion protein n=1 Tax=Cognataquiflexum rubidum TaxID=2922273 RepID=UPI001F13EAEE|nr:FHIPEP family type III secretion protein [Cognataquiflexum rubidum]MCH6235362.1 FHIPEP family type III secretion protein [Cognataquiflexum rubidum]